MAVSTKRKRNVSESLGPEDVQAVFRRAFEARFTPLVAAPEKQQVEQTDIQDEEEKEGEEEEEEDGDDTEGSDWSGISEDSDVGVQVVEYRDTQHKHEETDKSIRKAFMSSRPPISSAEPAAASTLKRKQDDSDAAEATNLKNDLALQKLLRDSHLLSASSSGTSTPTLSATGSARHKSADLHLQSLGAKSSVFAQKKMPMAQRKHEAQKARLMEEKRRAHAKDAGIVLEKERRNGKARVEKRREKGIGGPSIGKFKRGMLSLTNKDVRSIVGRNDKGKHKGKSRMKSKDSSSRG